jgi:hypothetical protein
MRRPKRDVEIFNMSFLDVISCGFGAVILLLVLALAFEPTTIEKISKNLRGLISEQEMSRENLIRESQALSRDLASKKKNLAELSARLTALNSSWDKVQKQYSAAQAKARERSRIEQQLEIVRQTLSEEMKRLLSQPDYKPPTEDATIGGIPVDSEYIIFVIDTSGSMKQGAWPLVVKKLQEILSVYPKVKGIQVLNDMGTYMFASYRGKWIPDTPGRRAAVVDTLKTWVSFSNSSPVEGILHAIRSFYRPDRPTSIFVLGDDFNGKSIDAVIKTVARINKKNAAGQSLVRIHTFGFPVLLLLANRSVNFIRYAHLMRILAEQNSGSFVGLNSLR